MIYVGQTTRTADERFKEHKFANSLLGRAIRTHGVENFKLEVIEKCETLDELNEREPYWIEFYNCIYPNGYNLDSGGSNAIPSDEVKNQISETLKKYYEEHPEAIDKISAEQKARFADPLEREKAAERTRLVFQNPESKQKHGEIQRKRFENQAERDKISEKLVEYFSDPAARQAQSERITNYFNQPGSCEKNSVSQKKRFENPDERKKISDGLKKYHAENPDAGKSQGAKLKGRKDSDETRKNKSIAQKARQAKLRAEREAAKAAVEINLFD